MEIPVCCGSPIVSIVITAYNQASYLEEAIQSVIKQDYPHIELIVLDDGSTDDTRAILAKYNGQFYWETHANMGQAATLNKGWGMSKGALLSYLSSDDYLMPNSVYTAVNELNDRPETVMVYSNFLLADEKSVVMSERIAPEYDNEQLVAQLVCMPGPGVFFRREAYEMAGGWDSTFRQMPDYDFWLRLSLFGPFFKIPEFLSVYRIHDESQSYTISDPEKSEEPIRAIRKFFNRADLPEPIARMRNKSLGNAFMVSARLHIRSGRYVAGLGRLMSAVGFYPAIMLTPRCIRIILNAIRYSCMRKLQT